MTLNKKQRIIICIGGLLLILTFLFPPWEGEFSALNRRDAGYHFLASPPTSIVTGKQRLKSLKDMLSNEQLRIAEYKIDKYMAEKPNLNREVLEAGFAQYQKNIEAGMPPARNVTADDFERLGRKRLARTTEDGYLLNVSNIYNPKLNYQRLIIQCAIVLIATLTALLMTSEKKR